MDLMGVANSCGNIEDPSQCENIIRKITYRIIPFIGLMYIICYLDRINVGFAALTMKKHLGFSDTVYGLGAGIFFIGYFFLQIPSNLILERIGASRWIAPIAILWGLISSAMMFVRDPMSFYVLRFFLGVAESGFFPGIILYLTYWFPEKERAKAVSLFMLGIPFSVVLGGPISGYLLGMAGKGGLMGWQWLFLIEGLPAVILGILVPFFLPDRPEHAKWLGKEEKTWLLNKLKLEKESDQGNNGQENQNGIFERIGGWTAFHLSLINMTIATSLYGITLWLPELIKRMSGLSNFHTAIVSALPYLAGALWMVIIGISSDKREERKWHIAISGFIGAIGMILIIFVSHTVLLTLVISLGVMGIIGTLGPFWALPGTLLRGRAAGGIALVNSMGNLGGFFGPYLIGIGKSLTQNFDGGLVFISIILVIGGILSLKLKQDWYQKKLSEET